MVTFLMFRCISCKYEHDSSEGEYDDKLCYDCIEELWEKQHSTMKAKEQEAR